MKRNIFRLMTLCTVAVLALASCKKDNGNDGNVPEKGFRATVEQIGDNGNNGSRTHINPENWNDGTTWPVLWTEGDQIVVYNGSEVRAFQLQSGENSNNGIFEPTDGQDYDYTSGPFSAFYCPTIVEIVPYLTTPEIIEMYFSGTTAVVDVPQNQTYKANSFAEGGMPMSAYSDGQTLEFKNLAGGLCFPILGAGVTITKVEVTSLSTNDAVSGYFNVDCADASHSLTPFSYGSYSMTNKNVTLNCSEGVTLDANPTYFTIMVAPGSLERGFTVKAYDGSDVVYEKTADWSASPRVGFIQRGVIRKLNSNLDLSPKEGKFTVDEDGGTISFAPGNLQYQHSTGTFRFASIQAETIGHGGGNSWSITNIGDQWMDVFCWGTSGYDNTANDPYAVRFSPASRVPQNNEHSAGIINEEHNYWGCGPSYNMPGIEPSLVGTSANYDWGVYNAIYNPRTNTIDPAGTWRTLTAEEMDYIINTRTTSSGVRYAKARVAQTWPGKNGVIIVPDDWDASIYTFNNPNTPTSSYSSNDVSLADWKLLERAGCVFLPCGGLQAKDDWEIEQPDVLGVYWTTTVNPNYYSERYAYALSFHAASLRVNPYGYRMERASVRLVKDVN